jgi:hypothetical protein
VKPKPKAVNKRSQHSIVLGLDKPGVFTTVSRKALAVDGIVGLVQYRAHGRHLRVCEHRIPARFLVRKPVAHALTVLCAYRRGDVVDKTA